MDGWKVATAYIVKFKKTGELLDPGYAYAGSTIDYTTRKEEHISGGKQPVHMQGVRGDTRKYEEVEYTATQERRPDGVVHLTIEPKQVLP